VAWAGDFSFREGEDSAMATALKSFLNSPVGPKTTHFWGPVANWGFVIAVRAWTYAWFVFPFINLFDLVYFNNMVVLIAVHDNDASGVIVLICRTWCS
jgi:hypothetical protein